MATRLVNPSSILRYGPSPALPHFPVHRVCHFVSMSPPLALRICLPFHAKCAVATGNGSVGAMRLALKWNSSNLLFHPIVRFEHRQYSIQGLVESVMEEIEAMRLNRKRVRASSRVVVADCEELLNAKLERRVLQKGILLEFQKDSDRTLLAVAQKPDGKRNWMVADQNGVNFSVKPQQVTYIVPGTEDFQPEEITNFLLKSQHLLDPSLLEYAWEELLEKGRSVNAEELAEIIYGKMGPLESYCAHLLLSQDEVYFSVGECKGYSSVYEPRPTSQVEELLLRKQAKEASLRDLEVFICAVKSAREQPIHAKPPKCSWQTDEKIQYRIKALEAFALDACKSDEQKRSAGEVLKYLGLSKTASSAIDLLIDIGYFPVHVNLELLKFEIPTDYSDDVLNAANDIFEFSPPDLDEINRKDLTCLKVYAIDVDEADELDDALSAVRLPDGCIKVWIHVADPTRWVDFNSILNKEARHRATSVFLPTATIPMFPVKLAMEKMSLKQGYVCNAVSVSVVLGLDGSITESNVENSTIKPTYMMTYEEASELLALKMEEEAELNLLSEAAVLRLKWRCQQGAIDTPTLEARVKVPNPDDPEPLINLYLQDQTDPAMRLVSEMMILCGEAIASFGARNAVPLPYRGQSQTNLSVSSISYLPEGPVRSSAYVRTMRSVEMDFRKPILHRILGVPGYVQFTSPIRRYVDLLAHYQVKAVLRGENPPYSSGQLEGFMSLINMRVRVARRICNSSLRYWLLEYLRRQPREKQFRALILRFVKNKMAALLLVEIGIQGSVEVISGAQVGDEIMVHVHEAHPRKEILSLKQSLSI